MSRPFSGPSTPEVNCCRRLLQSEPDGEPSHSARRAQRRSGRGRPRGARSARVGPACARAGRNARPVRRHPRELLDQPVRARARARHPAHQRPVHAARSVLHAAALHQPDVDPASYKLSVSGLVDRPITLSIDEIRKLGTSELVAGFECSGNSPGRLQGLSSNGRWTGVALKTLLARAGVQADADEVVFFGADRGEEDVDFRGRIFKVQQQFGRSLSVADATKPEPFLAHALDGQPLTKQQGFPLRLIVPGWYGVANVKWL